MGVYDESLQMPPRSDDPASPQIEPSDPDYVVIRTALDLQRLSADILGDRDRPIVGLTPSAEGPQPVLAASEVRALVGPGVRIYLIPDDELLQEFQEMIGPRLRTERAAVRIWWPGASVRCDPVNHPLVVALEGERPEDTLEEFTEQFHLSRPRVRREIMLMEDARAFLEREFDGMQQRNRELHERLRDTQVECHRLRTRAERAEARLTAALRQPDSG
jgi:hypothetical protein